MFTSMNQVYYLVAIIALALLGESAHTLKELSEANVTYDEFFDGFKRLKTSLLDNIKKIGDDDFFPPSGRMIMVNEYSPEIMVVTNVSKYLSLSSDVLMI